jgi:hypothetical protein
VEIERNPAGLNVDDGSGGTWTFRRTEDGEKWVPDLDDTPLEVIEAVRDEGHTVVDVE